MSTLSADEASHVLPRLVLCDGLKADFGAAVSKLVNTPGVPSVRSRQSLSTPAHNPPDSRRVRQGAGIRVQSHKPAAECASLDGVLGTLEQVNPFPAPA